MKKFSIYKTKRCTHRAEETRQHESSKITPDAGFLWLNKLRTYEMEQYTTHE